MSRYCGYVSDNRVDDGGGNVEAGVVPQPQEPLPDESQPLPPPSATVGMAELPAVLAKDSDKSAIIIFFSNVGLATMRTSNEINVDGTFGTCPHPFKQIVFIQAKQAGQRSVPVVFALLTKKVTLIQPQESCPEYKYSSLCPACVYNVPNGTKSFRIQRATRSCLRCWRSTRPSQKAS